MDFFKKPVKEVSSFDELVKIFFYMFVFYCLTQNLDKGNIKKKIEDKIKNTFTNSIIGLKSVKEEINYYMDFIKNQIKYQDWGVKLPKGNPVSRPTWDW